MTRFQKQSLSGLLKILPAVFFLSTVLWSCSNGPKSSGSSYEKVKQQEDSIRMLTRQIENDSANGELFSKRAALYLKSGRIDPAFRDVGQAIELNPEAAVNFIMLGDIYFVLGKIDNCISAYKKAARLEPENEKPLLKLAETYLMLRDFGKAAVYINRAIAVNPNSSMAFYFKGIELMETGDTLQSITQLRIAANLDSSNYRALMQAGALLSAVRDTLSVEYFTAALKARPEDEKALYYLARELQEQGKFDQAIAKYGKVNILYAENKMAYYNEGYIYLVEKKEYGNAVEAFEQAIAIDPSFVEAVYNLGRTFEAMGRYDEAREQYKTALKLKTNYPLAIDGLNRLDSIQFPE
ncbi:MAG: tetratricopeptide repeat protein [Chlorobi bacterium]|nr:tetratricopeptide repeat protein [Chlorobiota bacterium]